MIYSARVEASPFRLFTLPEARLGLAVGQGKVNGDDIIGACHLLTQMDDWAAGFNEMWDLLGTTEVDVTPDSVRAAVAAAHDHADALGNGRVACVTTRDGVAMLVRLIEAMTTELDRSYRAFHTRAAAAAWLGLDRAQAERVIAEHAA